MNELLKISREQKKEKTNYPPTVKSNLSTADIKAPKKAKRKKNSFFKNVKFFFIYAL